MTMADRIVVMKDGAILQIGTPTDLYDNPADVHRELHRQSSMNPARAAEGKDVVPHKGGDLLIGIRPHDLLVGDLPASPALELQGKVTAFEPLGPETLVHLDVDGADVIATAPARFKAAVGEAKTCAAKPGSLYLFDASTEKALGRHGLMPASI
jgi:multiple sugar transport system ATP-binding protein